MCIYTYNVMVFGGWISLEANNFLHEQVEMNFQMLARGHKVRERVIPYPAVPPEP